MLNGLNVSTPQTNCKGNGKTLGLTDGTNLTGLTSASNPYALYRGTPYNGNVGASAVLTYPTSLKLIGITTESAKSGIVADATTSTISNYQNARGIIKY